MSTRRLSRSPRALELYARAAVPLLPGASRLPFVSGGGGAVPDLELTLDGVRPDRERLAAYARVCGFRLRDELPATYPHILAFPLHLALMTDGRFPFPAVGLVHVGNSIRVHRPLRLGESLDLRVRATPVEPHPRGSAFSLLTEVRVAGELAWASRSTMLRRGGGDDGGARGGARAAEPPPPPVRARWDLPGDLGRRYAAVSGDANPIHLHGLTARLFGFERPIAHGMWTKARCLAALERDLPPAYEVEAAFRKPIALPGAVAFRAAAAGGETRFAVTAGEDEGRLHLEGTVTG